MLTNHPPSPKSRLPLLWVLPALVFLGVFYFWPLGSILRTSFEGGGLFDSLWALVGKGYFRRILWFTFGQAVVSTVLTVLVALPGAYVFATFDFPGKRFLNAASTVPFVLPTVVVAAAFDAAFGTSGAVNSVLQRLFGTDAPVVDLHHTVWMILAAHVFFNYAVVFRVVGSYWAGLGNHLNEAARTLGAPPVKAFFHVTLPLLMPAILSSAVLVFVFCFSSFGVVLILGGPRFSTIEVEIYRQAVSMFNLPMAATLSLVQIACGLGLMWVYTSLQRKLPGGRFTYAPERTLKTAGEWLFVGSSVLFVVLFLCGPLVALLTGSLQTEDGFSLNYYLGLFQSDPDSILFLPPQVAVFNSLKYASATVLLALLLGLPTAFFLVRGGKQIGKMASLIDPVFMLPLCTSAVTLGFGFVVGLDEPPLNLRASRLLPVFAHTLVAFPFAVRSLVPAVRAIPESLREAASILGASPWRVFGLVDIPLIGRALGGAAVFSFTISMGEFGATAFVAGPVNPTMPLAIFRYLGQPGAMNHGRAMAMSCILMLVTVIGFYFIEWCGGRGKSGREMRRAF